MIGTPIENLTIAQIKDEMRTAYAVKNFNDCLELKDLQDKLATMRNTQLMTHGLQYGELLQIGNKKDPSGVVTFSHGLGDSARGWEDVAQNLSRRFPHLLFLLPTAPQRPVTINMGMTMNAWYDIKDMNINSAGRQDAESVLISADYLKSLAYTTTQRFRIPSGRVVYAGFSQGAAISLVAGLTSFVAPAGIAVLSGYLAGANDVLQCLRNKSASILMCHGTQDPVIPFAAAEQSKVVLEKAGVSSITLKAYPMEHSASPEEIADLEQFLQRVLPPQVSKA